MKRLVIGMTAHVDAGKTTLTEALLYRGGAIRKQGRVDKGDSFLDTHEIERSRGITVFSKQAVLQLEDGIYTFLDTPGHTDFSAETERAFGVLDCAVLVISGTDGVQSHTETVWRLLKRYGVPVFIFVNKTDISPYGREVLLSGLRERLSDRITGFSPKSGEDLYDALSTLSEEMMNSYLDSGEVPTDMIRRAVSRREVFPCYFGSALKLDGIDEFLQGLREYSPAPEYGEDFAARVYKITADGSARLTHMKITGGNLRVRTELPSGEKITGIRIYSGAKFTSAEEVPAGTLCAVTGLTAVKAGDGLGTESAAAPPVLEPVLSYRVRAADGTDSHTLLGYLRRLEEEDPQLRVSFNERSGETTLRLMGKIQLEILRSVIAERFGVKTEFDAGSIAYKETIAAPALGIGHYEPLRHYAEAHLLLEPLPRGSGLEIVSDCSEDILDRNWQRLIISNLKAKTHIGVLTGSPVTDMRITLVTGRAHLKHTEGGDFRQAACRAVRMGLRSAESVLLEPYYSFTLDIPSESVGRAMTDLQRMGAEFSPPETSGDKTVIRGKVPVSEMADYHTEVLSYTKGKGKLVCEYGGYYPCHNSAEVIERTGYDPDSDLDEPADSVFCAHGAGYIVKWNEVRAHAHTDSGISFGGGKTPAEDNPPPRRIYSPAADDDELMAIFERTYGKIKRPEREAVRRVYDPPAEKKRAAQRPSGPAYLLVDGYNIIFAWEELKKLAEDNLDLARGRLINILASYRGFKKCEVILVFDAYKVKGQEREIERVSGISVVYTREAETADMYIEKTSHELAKDCLVRVATSDGTEQMIILGSGAFRVSAAELYEEIKAVEKEIGRITNAAPAGRGGNIRVKGGKDGAADN